MFKNALQQGRSRFDARSVRSVRERERLEERQVCEPEDGKTATMSVRSQRTPLSGILEHFPSLTSPRSKVTLFYFQDNNRAYQTRIRPPSSPYPLQPA